MNDLEFVQRCVSGDKLAWDQFVDKYSRLIYSYIYSVLKTKGLTFSKENVNDFFQEVFLSLSSDNFKKLRSYRGINGCSLSTWLRTVTINQVLSYLRQLRPTVSLDEEKESGVTLKDILKDNSRAIDEKMISEEKIAQLKDCIEGLEQQDKYFIELHIYRELPLEKLKRHFRLTRSALDMRKSRLVAKLKDCFKHKGFLLDF